MSLEQMLFVPNEDEDNTVGDSEHIYDRGEDVEMDSNY